MASCECLLRGPQKAGKLPEEMSVTNASNNHAFERSCQALERLDQFVERGKIEGLGPIGLGVIRFGMDFHHQAIRTGRHKYIQYRELRDMDELYDLDDDPYEMTNLVARPEATDVLRQMRAELERLLVDTQ